MARLTDAQRQANREQAFRHVLLMRDIAAFIERQRAERRYRCGHCQGKVERKKNATIECRRCGRSAPAESYEEVSA